MLNTVDSRNRDVQRIDFRLFWQRHLFEQFLGQVVNVVGRVELSDIGENIQTLLGSDRVAFAAFVDDELRYEQIEVWAVVVPPIMGQLLVCRRDQITTRPRREITDDAGFEVDGGVHESQSSPVARLAA